MNDTPINLIREENAILSWIKHMKNNPSSHAFVAFPNRGVGADRSCVLIGTNKKGFVQAIKFWHGDHKKRAEAAAHRLNMSRIQTNVRPTPPISQA